MAHKVVTDRWKIMLRYAKYVAQKGIYGRWEIVLDGKDLNGIRKTEHIVYCKDEFDAKKLAKLLNPKKKKKKRAQSRRSV